MLRARNRKKDKANEERKRERASEREGVRACVFESERANRHFESYLPVFIALYRQFFFLYLLPFFLRGHNTGGGGDGEGEIACQVDADCDDGLACNGIETCIFDVNGAFCSKGRQKPCEYSSCIETTSLTKGYICCGDGMCSDLDGETYDHCPADCGAGVSICGDANCDVDEDVSFFSPFFYQKIYQIMSQRQGGRPSCVQ